MKIYKKNEIPIFSSMNSTKGSFSPMLTDCKSSINLWQSFEETHKDCESTNFKKEAKSINQQFLRHTVNIKKPDLAEAATQISTSEYWRNKQKKNFPQAPNSASDLQECETACFKVICQSEKKNSNPEKKEEMQLKQNILPKFLEKKVQIIDKINVGISKTVKVGVMNSEIRLLEKTTYTPKTIKSGENRNIRTCSEKTLCSSEDFQKKFNNEFLFHGCKKDPKITDFKRLKFLGEGRFGKVHLAVHIETGFIYALKQIKKECIIKNKMGDQLLLEIKMQSYIDHPNILKLYGVFNDEKNIYLILEFMEQGSLYSQLKRFKKIPEDEAARKLKDVLNGVNHLHEHKIAHRDIKPENIVISNDVSKICDLGWAAVCEDRRKTLCGTIDYASPEVLEGKEYGISIDLWCLGVLCYELMVGKCPFYHMSRKETMKKIINTDKLDLNIPEDLSEESKNFIEKLLVKNPEERMSAFEALNHPLIVIHSDKEEEEELKSSLTKKN